MINKFIEDFEKNIDSNPIILSSNIQKYFGPDGNTTYLKSNVIFIDSSRLEIALFIKEVHGTVSIGKYRYQYMNNQQHIFFRYDNAPHHPEIPSHPHHKHIERLVVSTNPPSLKEILNEISAIILKK